MHGDLNILNLFFQADVVVKGVMILLALFSIWSWTVIGEKWMLYRSTTAQLEKFDEVFWSGKALDHLYDEVADAPQSPVERVFASGMREWVRSVETGAGLFLGLRDRLDRAMNVAVARETELVQTRLGHLATIGAIAPFIGLFGTVWGIMNSFNAIAAAGDASLAVVAPGIAEALLATALGLLAAIPAVIAYNQLLGSANRINARLENFADEFATILSRQLDKRGV